MQCSCPGNISSWVDLSRIQTDKLRRSKLTCYQLSHPTWISWNMYKTGLVSQQIVQISKWCDQKLRLINPSINTQLIGGTFKLKIPPLLGLNHNLTHFITWQVELCYLDCHSSLKYIWELAWRMETFKFKVNHGHLWKWTVFLRKHRYQCQSSLTNC